MLICLHCLHRRVAPAQGLLHYSTLTENVKLIQRDDVLVRSERRGGAGRGPGAGRKVLDAHSGGGGGGGVCGVCGHSAGVHSGGGGGGLYRHSAGVHGGGGGGGFLDGILVRDDALRQAALNLPLGMHNRL